MTDTAPSSDEARSVDWLAVPAMLLGDGARATSRVWARLGVATALLVATGLSLTYIFQRPLGLWLVGRGVESGLQTQAWLDALPDGLHAGLCGSGAPLADANRTGPCVFVVAGRRVYIVDAVEGSPRKMAGTCGAARLDCAAATRLPRNTQLFIGMGRVQSAGHDFRPIAHGTRDDNRN